MTASFAPSTTPSAAAATAPVLRVERVSKVYPARFGRAAVRAVDQVAFDLAPGEILGLLGPNGAGKTTTIKMVAGLLVPSEGRIEVDGCDVARQRMRAASRLGAVLEGNRNLHWKLTAAENLAYFGALKGIRRVRERAAEVLDRLELGAHAKKRVGELSRGLQQRVAIGVALLGSPRVLLLDEPTLGLDVLAASSFKQIVRAIAQDGCGIVLTTHQMEVAQELSDRVAIIAGGQLAVIDSLDQLLSAHRTPGYLVEVRGVVPEAAWSALAELGAEQPEDLGRRTRFRLPEGASDALYRALVPLREAQVELVSIQQDAVDLEAVYRRVVGGTR